MMMGFAMRLLLASIFSILVSLPCIAEDKSFEQKLPFSEVVRVGNTLYLSGVVGNMQGTRQLVPGGIGPETKQVMETIRARVEKHGSDMDHVVKCLVMLADINEWAAMNEVYKTFFSKRYPARSALGASGLALGARVEIECIAEIVQ
jgi:2-iminobutanoate/2-iminopropanoate deaminase